MPAAVGARDALAAPLFALRRVVEMRREHAAVMCLLANTESLTISHFLAGFVRPSDQIEFDPAAVGTSQEVRIVQNTSLRPKELYFGPIGYVTQPKPDRRGDYFIRAAIDNSSLGVKRIHLPSEAVRDYFYFGNRRQPGCEDQTLFDVLHATPVAGPADLRLALKVKLLELQAMRGSRDDFQTAERAFNLLAHPQIRSCYEALLRDPDAPALFPYGGFGVMLTSGELSPDRATFFAKKILSFLPDRRERRFRAPLRKIEFFDDHAIYRDSRRKAEVVLDAISLPVAFDASWNQWKHLAGTKVGIAGVFVKSGAYRFRGGEWSLMDWETALPSRLEITLPSDARERLANARKTHHQFGQFFDALQRIRARLERQPLDREELVRLCDELGIPPGFDVAQVSWKPDYDEFYYGQLTKRTRKMFLFREEYIFELQRAIVVEVPQQGHATYVFSRPSDIDCWVRLYADAAKADIRHNRNNAAERLGFVGRVMHGTNPRTWLRELRLKAGEPADFSITMDGP